MKKRTETVVFREGSLLTDKTFIRQLNLLLFFLVLLLGSLLLSYLFGGERTNPIVSDSQKAVIQSVHAEKEVIAAKTIRIPILMYHYVEYVTDMNDTFRMSMNITPDVFEKQLITLKDNGFTFLTMRELASALEGNTALPKKPVVLTFDDGYKDFFDVVLPILKKHTVKSVSYVSPGLLDQPNYMSRDNVIEIAGSGLVEVASHTVQHTNLSGASLQSAYYEIYESKRELEALIGEEVVSFAYPYGGFDEQSASLLHEAGYETAVTTEPGVEFTSGSEFRIMRIRPGVRVGEELVRYLEQDAFVPY